MGAHKHNPVAIAAKNGDLPPKTKFTYEQFTLIASWCFQFMFDMLTLVLRDPDVMKKDVFGKRRRKMLEAALNERAQLFLPGLDKTNPKSSYVRAMADRELEKADPEDFQPWPERYWLWDDSGI